VRESFADSVGIRHLRLFKQLDRGRVLLLLRQVERRPVFRVFPAAVGAAVEKQRHELDVAVPCGDVKRVNLRTSAASTAAPLSSRMPRSSAGSPIAARWSAVH